MTTEVLEAEVIETRNVPVDAIEKIERANVDIQISTARAYPRQLAVVKRDMMEMALQDTETASKCFYSLHRKNADGTVKIIEGPSIRLAEIALNAWTNISAGSRVISDDGKFITAQGVAFDLQRNIRISKEVKRRVTNKEGKRFSEDMVAVTGNAACSIALRNAITAVIPAVVIKPVYDAAKKAAVGDEKTLNQRRNAALTKFKEMGVDDSRVYNALGIKGFEDITLDRLTVLIGMYNAINDKESTVEEMFPSLTVKAPSVTQSKTTVLTAGSGVPVPEPPKKKVPEDLIWLEKNMVENDISEKTMLDYLHAEKFADDTLTTLSDIAEMQPEAIARMKKFWKSVVKVLKPQPESK